MNKFTLEFNGKSKIENRLEFILNAAADNIKLLIITKYNGDYQRYCISKDNTGNADIIDLMDKADKYIDDNIEAIQDALYDIIK